MIEIIASPLTRLRRKQHLGLMTEVDRLILKETALKLGLEQQYRPFKAALAVENAAVEIESGSLTTSKMEDEDVEREASISGFTYLVENGLRHFDSTKRDAAVRIKHIVEKYGSFRRATNAEETVSIRSMCNELLSAGNLPYLSALSDGVEWVTRIQTANEEYSALYELRNAETKGTPTTNSLEAREIMDPCYIAIVKRVNALAEVNGEANYSSFINQLNGFITDLKNTMAVQDAARKKVAVAAPTVG